MLHVSKREHTRSMTIPNASLICTFLIFLSLHHHPAIANIANTHTNTDTHTKHNPHPKSLIQQQSKSNIMFCGGFFPNLFQTMAKPDTSTTTMSNSAIVFVKPHANTQAVRDLVSKKLKEAAPSMTIQSEQSISGPTIDKEQLIDQHYYAIASKATILTANEISSSVPTDLFHESFGEDWSNVLSDGRAANAMEACTILDCDASELSDLWRAAEAKGLVVKFGGGFYCGKLAKNDKVIYVFNAFFMTMRAGFVDPDCSIHCYEVEWDPKELSWEDFRGKVLGPTDPSQAPKGSIRRTILNEFKRLGLDAKPNKGLNGVHASASPFEGLSEKSNWLGKKIEDDAFGAALMKAGLKKKVILEWCKDPRVTVEADSMGSLFDALEDTDVGDCFTKLTEINKLN